MPNSYNQCLCGKIKQKRSPCCRRCSNKVSMEKFPNKIGFIKGYTPWNKGTKGLMSWSPQQRAKIAAYVKIHGGGMKGKKMPLSARQKQSIALLGEKAPNWQGGITPLNTRRRHSLEHKDWRERVFGRDSFTCQVCLSVGGRLAPHHIKPWRSFIEIRYDTSNGITLCRMCHELTFKKEEILIDFFEKILVSNILKNRVNSGNLLEEMKTILRQS